MHSYNPSAPSQYMQGNSLIMTLTVLLFISFLGVSLLNLFSFKDHFTLVEVLGLRAQAFSYTAADQTLMYLYSYNHTSTTQETCQKIQTHNADQILPGFVTKTKLESFQYCTIQRIACADIGQAHKIDIEALCSQGDCAADMFDCLTGSKKLTILARKEPTDLVMTP